jgi:hypothetical protein
MKKSLLLLVVAFMSFFATAQETVKQKEVGVVFSNLDRFGLTFKIGNEKSLWRFNSLVLSGSDRDYIDVNFDDEHRNAGFGVSVGREYRKKAAENFEFRYGADLSFNYSYSKLTSTDKNNQNAEQLSEQTIYTPGINLVLGINYLINDNIILGAEVLPFFTYNTGNSIYQDTYPIIGEEMKTDISGFSYGLSSSSVLLSLTYRF